MKKTIILSENTFKKIKNIMIKEAMSSTPEFGTPGKGGYIHYGSYLDSLNKIPNLHSDRYKDYELDSAYKDWKNTGYDKNSEEYLIYLSRFKHFMFGDGGFIRNVSYTLDRLNGPLHSLLLDPKWVTSLNGKPNWKYSDLNSGQGGDEFHCFYTTVLKLFQNPAIWNDFFFNPLFSEAKNKYDAVRAKITDLMKKEKDLYDTKYKQLIPMEEYRQLNFFMNEINQETKKVEKGLNAKPELFYSQELENNSMDFEDGEEEY